MTLRAGEDSGAQSSRPTWSRSSVATSANRTRSPVLSMKVTPVRSIRTAVVRLSIS